jgi:hypothetical protein
VYDGWQSSSPVLGVYCGKLGRFSVKSTGRFILIQFRSNLLVEGKGFKANYEAIKTSVQEPPKGMHCSEDSKKLYFDMVY